jgi:ferredoxin
VNQSLRENVKRLFAEGKVKSVLGYREHPLSKAVVATLITRPEDADTLIFDYRCVQNLARGLTRDLPLPVGIVVKGCDGRAVSMRITEGDFAREQIVAIAVACPGVKADGKTFDERCQRCEMHVSPLADVTVGDVSALPKPEKTRAETIAKIKAMTPAERFEFWQKAFEPCTHCYACREVCPLCNCVVCVTDQNAPRWIEQTAKPSSNLMWHMIRAFHHAGRCVDCGECQRACPEGVPMHLLDLCLAEDVEELFDFETGVKQGGKWPFLLFNPEDPDSWLGGPHRG